MHAGSLIATPLLILLTGFFVAAEFAAVRVRSTQLEAIQDSDPRAVLALEVHRHLSQHPHHPQRHQYSGRGEHQ